MRESIELDRLVCTGPRRLTVLVVGLGVAGVALGVLGPVLLAAPGAARARLRGGGTPGAVSARSRRR